MKPYLQFRFRQQPYRLTFRLGFFLWCLFFVVVFCLLGVWQSHRYQYKKNLLATYTHRLSGAPVPLLQLKDPIATLQFQHVMVKGEYVNDLTMLIQNQFHQEQLGFNVITPLKIPGEKKLLLVDRGWVPAVQHNIAPKISPTRGTQQVSGYIKLINEYQFILGQNILNPTIVPLVIQKVDVNELSQLTHQTYYPFVIRLDDKTANGFIRDWSMTTAITPERHLGYAIQWFLMAIVLAIAYICFCCEREEKN